jgi:hypothetical protein
MQMNRFFKVGLPLLFTFILLFSVFYVKIRNPYISPENTLLKSFQNSEARFVNSELYLHGKLSGKTDTLEEIKQLVGDVEKHLGVVRNNSYSVTTKENDNLKKIELNGTTAGGMLVNASIQLDAVRNQAAEDYFSVSASSDSLAGVENTRQALLEVCTKYRLQPKVISCLTGTWEGRVDNAKLNEICRSIFRETGAMKVEGVRDHNLISVSAYSPAIRDSIQVNGNRINLNLAIRYNAYENKTYLWLATPVISTEY